MKNLFNYNKDETVFNVFFKAENKIGSKLKKISCLSSSQKIDTFFILTQYQKKDSNYIINLIEIEIISEVYLEKILVSILFY